MLADNITAMESESGDQEVGPGYKSPRPTPRDLLPLVKFHPPKVHGPSELGIQCSINEPVGTFHHTHGD